MTRLAGMVAFQDDARARKEEVVDEKSNREIAEGSFREWQDGTGYITDLLAEDLTWTIVGRSRASKTYESKEQFIREVLAPFSARFSELFRPVKVRTVYEDGDTVVVVWDGKDTRLDGKPYENTYAWQGRHESRVAMAQDDLTRQAGSRGGTRPVHHVVQGRS